MKITDYGKSCFISATLECRISGTFKNIDTIDIVIGTVTPKEAFELVEAKLTSPYRTLCVYLHYYYNGKHQKTITLNHYADPI